MSGSFWLILAAVTGICVFVFTKTVSNDAKNDYRIRDILTNSKTVTKPEATEEKEPAAVAATPKQSFEEYQNEHNIYEELAAKQKESGYSSYSTTTHTTESKNESAQEKPKFAEEKIYYEKINDDACPYSKDDDDDDDYYEKEPKMTYNSNNTKYQKDFEEKEEPLYQKPRKNLFDYIKTFWKGITFAIGLLVCLYAFGGLAYNVQTSNDAIVYSIWLLIGVILIK